MPRWQPSGIANALTAFVRRYRLGTSITDVWTGIIPVAQVDKHWQDDRLDIWGMFVQGGADAGPAPQLLSATLFAQDLEVLVHRVDGWWAGQVSNRVHLFTPLQTYDPAATNPNVFFPWLQTMVQTGDAGRLSRAFGIGGYNGAHQVVTVSGTPFTTFGPFSPLHTELTPGGRVHRFWGFQDPPIRLKPFERLTVQALGQAAFITDVLGANFYYSEREPQGNVG